MTELPDGRLLLVHAHPDDESINNGATMARYTAEGAHVTLVTHPRRGGRGYPARAGASRARPRGRARPAPDRRAGCCHEGARGHRPPLPRRSRRFGDSGMMGLSNHRARLLVRRRRRGRGVPGRGDPRGPSPGARHLRPRRGLRTPGPHPGPPRRRARRRTGRGPRRPPRPRRTLDDQVYWQPRPALRRRGGLPAAARGPARTALRALRRRGRRTRRGRRHGGHHRDRRDPRTPPRRPPPCGRTPPRSRWPNPGSRCRTHSRNRCSPPSTTSWCAGSARDPVVRPTSSRGSNRVPRGSRAEIHGSEKEGRTRDEHVGQRGVRSPSRCRGPRPGGSLPTWASSCSVRWSGPPECWCKPPGSRAGCCSPWPARPGSSWADRGRPASRAGAVAPAAGWIIAVVLLTSTRPEGDFFFGAGFGSYLFLLGGTAGCDVRHAWSGAATARLRRPTWEVTSHFAVPDTCGSRASFLVARFARRIRP